MVNTCQRQIKEVMNKQWTGHLQASASTWPSIGHLEQAVAAAPDDLAMRTDLARAYRGAGRFREAFYEIQQVLRAHRSGAPAWWALADILVDLGRYAKSAAAFRRAQALDIYRAELKLARRAWRAGNACEAQARYQAILREDATHVGALCGLAGLHLGVGRTFDAERLLRHAVAQSAYFPSALRLLGQTYLESGRLPEAQAAIRRSLDLEPHNEQGWLALAAIEGRLMQPEAALAAYEQAERINPQRRLVHLSIGHVLKTLGRRRECERIYHECLERDPTSGEAYWSLADLKNYFFSDAEVASMESLLDPPKGDEDNAALLHFALGRAREQRQQYMRAFGHYASANRLRGSKARFDYDLFESRCGRLISCLDRDFFAASRGSGVADDSPIFVIGLPRSGSTLVEQILASHSSIDGTMELPNILNYVREFEQLSADGDAYPESLRTAPRAVLEALGRRYIEETRPLRRGGARFIDKLPNNFSHIGLIHAMLPNATIIDVRRHPMDAGLSCFKQCFAAGQTFTYDLAGLGRYYRQYLALMDHWDAVLPGKVLHVIYEELVRAPETVIRAMLAHCGLEFESQCLRFHETKRVIRTASSEQVRQPMSTSGIGYWRNFERELAPLRHSLGDCLERFAAVDRLPLAAVGMHAAREYTSHRAPRIVLSCAISAVLYASVTARALPSAIAEDTLAEIVVTARKRTENVQDVPQNVDVFTAQNIKDLGIVRFEDFVALSPSISMISTGPGGQRITIRGASDGSTANYGFGNGSTTGYLVDDLALDFYGHDPDLHLYDIERIEVLNGPQGTLFGPGALAGAVRIITNKPDPKAFSAGVDFDGGTIAGGANNWSYQGYANIPLIEGNTALRASAFSVREGGYINNVLATRAWVNGVTSTNAPWAGNNFNFRDILGGRIALLQNIGENWHFTVTENYQQQNYHGSWEDDPTNVAPREVRQFAPAGGYNYARFLELHLDGDVGIGDLIYIGGLSSQAALRLYNFSEYSQYSPYASFVQSTTCVTDPASGPGDHGCTVPYMYGRVASLVRRLSNEVRLQSKPGHLHWTVGAYAEKIRNPYSGVEHLPNINFKGAPAQDVIADYHNVAMPVAGEYYSGFDTFDYSQVSEFGDVTFDLDDLWSIEAGAEHFHSGQSEVQQYANYFYQPRVSAYHSASSNKTNLKAGINFKPQPHSLLYFTFAQGFRDGGYNYGGGGSKFIVPAYFTPDTLNNYELGWKTESSGGRLVWNSAAYYMAWKDYQVGVSIPVAPYGFNANIGDARIAGLETTLEMVPVEGLHLSLTGNYNDARLRSNAFQSPSFVVIPGERLPEAPLFNASAIARYERRIASDKAFAQVDFAHKGSMWNSLQVDQRTLQPAYNLVNLRLGLGDAAGAWQAEGYVTNVANKRAVVYVDTTGYAYYPGHSNPELATPPRIIGLRLSYKWGK
jgi:outer membrane receptor protein involved in Fe transport/tetratricopeptide (TPR) repeat protein